MSIPENMNAMVLEAPGEVLHLRQIPVPEPGAGQVLVRIRACGVCRTDLHIVDGELTEPKLPLIPGHEIVGQVVKSGPDANLYQVGDRIGIPWLGYTCGKCRYCRNDRENLCDNARFTGYTLDGGYAEYTVADERYCFPIPAAYSDAEASPLLCAGLIGYRSYRLAGTGIERLGIYGFGAAAHLIAQIAIHEGKQVYAFTRPGDVTAQQFARDLGAVWAGSSMEPAPEMLDAAIIFAPVGELIPLALASTVKGGIVASGGIHMSDIPGFPYRLLWGERQIRSVANLTREDGFELMRVAQEANVHTTVQVFPLREANEALNRLRAGQIQGAAVLIPSDL